MHLIIVRRKQVLRTERTVKPSIDLYPYLGVGMMAFASLTLFGFGDSLVIIRVLT